MHACIPTYTHSSTAVKMRVYLHMHMDRVNRYSRSPGAQPQQYEYRISPGSPSSRQEHGICKVNLFLKEATLA